MGPSQDPLTEIARTGKVHGLDGTIRLLPLLEAVPPLQVGSLLYLETRRGERIPVRIVQVRLEEKRNTPLFFVKFDRISSRSEAERVQDCAVYADLSHLSKDAGKSSGPEAETPPLSVTGFEVVDENGRVGVVGEVLQQPAQSLLRVKTERGEEDPEAVQRSDPFSTPDAADEEPSPPQEFLIPWVDEYVVSTDWENRRLICRNLDPLKDL